MKRKDNECRESSEHAGSWEDFEVQKMRKPQPKADQSLTFRTWNISNRIRNSFSFGEVQHVSIALSHRNSCILGNKCINPHYVILGQNSCESLAIWNCSQHEILIVFFQINFSSKNPCWPLCQCLLTVPLYLPGVQKVLLVYSEEAPSACTWTSYQDWFLSSILSGCALSLLKG